MYFKFENMCQNTEALVTAAKYNKTMGMYELTVLGLDADGFSYTIQGKAFFDDEDFDELIKSGELEFPHDIIGRRLKLVSNNFVKGSIENEK